MKQFRLPKKLGMRNSKTFLCTELHKGLTTQHDILTHRAAQSVNTRHTYKIKQPQNAE